MKNHEFEFEISNTPLVKEDLSSINHSKAFFNILQDKLDQHNQKYPRAKTTIGHLRNLFARNIGKGVCFSFAYINAFLKAKVENSYECGEITQERRGVWEVDFSTSPTSKDLEDAQTELKSHNLDNVSAASLYFEAELALPAWKALI